MDPNEALAEIRLLCVKDNAPGESLEPHEVQRLTELFQGLDAWICNGGFWPTDWDPIPPGAVQFVQHWVDLREQRAVASEAADDDLDYDSLRKFEEQQEDLATEIADINADWFAALGKLQ